VEQLSDRPSSFPSPFSPFPLLLARPARASELAAMATGPSSRAAGIAWSRPTPFPSPTRRPHHHLLLGLPMPNSALVAVHRHCRVRHHCRRDAGAWGLDTLGHRGPGKGLLWKHTAVGKPRHLFFFAIVAGAGLQPNVDVTDRWCSWPGHHGLPLATPSPSSGAPESRHAPLPPLAAGTTRAGQTPAASGHPLLRSREGEGKDLCPLFSLNDMWAHLGSRTHASAPLEILLGYTSGCAEQMQLGLGNAVFEFQFHINLLKFLSHAR
jgi:hypothetical protein